MNRRMIPMGVRDMLPDEVKRFRKLENVALTLFQQYGYEEVIPPMLEYMDVIEAGTGEKVRDQLLLFMDRTGEILALRPEYTVSIARLATTHLESRAIPQRLCYSGSVFRHVQPQMAQYREFRQVGIEMLGAAGPFADAEVIHIAGELLSSLGLPEYKISLNHIGIFNSLLADSTLLNEEKNQVKDLIARKDLVALEELLNQLVMPESLKETLLQLPIVHGGLEVFDQLPYLMQGTATRAAVDELVKVYEVLKSVYGSDGCILIDMGILRGFDYYTGVVFEGYSPRLGYGILGGGRYDHLLDQFQSPSPATGFALGLERLTLALGADVDRTPGILVAGKDLMLVNQQAEVLRKTHSAVIAGFQSVTREEAEKWLMDLPEFQLFYVDSI